MELSIVKIVVIKKEIKKGNMNNYRTRTSEDRTDDYCECLGFSWLRRCGHIELMRARLGMSFDTRLAHNYLKRKDRQIRRGNNGMSM
jgi:hypothetical protein